MFGSPLRFIWLVGVYLEPSWAISDASLACWGSSRIILGQPVPCYLACWGPSWHILASPCRFIWFVGVHLGPSWTSHAVLSGLLGSILAHLSQPMPFYLASWGPSWPILASPCRFIWLVGVYPFWASPCHFIWLLGVHLEPSWPAHAVLSGLLGSILAHLGRAHAVLYGLLGSILAHLGPSWAAHAVLSG